MHQSCKKMEPASNMSSTMKAAATALKRNPNLIEAVGSMWENLTELSKNDPERYFRIIYFLNKIILC